MTAVQRVKIEVVPVVRLMDHSDVMTIATDTKQAASMTPWCYKCSSESPFHLPGCPDSPESQLQ